MFIVFCGCDRGNGYKFSSEISLYPEAGGEIVVGPLPIYGVITDDSDSFIIVFDTVQSKTLEAATTNPDKHNTRMRVFSGQYLVGVVDNRVGFGSGMIGVQNGNTDFLKLCSNRGISVIETNDLPFTHKEALELIKRDGS